MSRDESYHAIYFVLNDFDFFPASLRSVYPHITGATVVTSYDRDRFGRPVVPERTVDALLSRSLDPDSKVNVIVSSEGSEAGLRNRAMAFASPPPGVEAFAHNEAGTLAMAVPDWFWIIDADEIYAEPDIHRMKQFVGEQRASAYSAEGYSYWRTWNWRIEGGEHRIVLVRPGRWFEHLRHLELAPLAKAHRKLRHLGLLSGRTRPRGGLPCPIPKEVALFHHGDFVGRRERIEAKVQTSGHREHAMNDWLTRVWDAWTPQMRDLHPFHPTSFPIAQHIDTDALPSEISGHEWPEGWLER